MENQDPWEPTFPVGYILPPENSYGGSGGSRPSPKPAYPEGGLAVNTSTAAASAASAASTEAARRSSGEEEVGAAEAVAGRGNGGGDKERPNAIAYNNTYVDGWWGLFRHAG